MPSSLIILDMMRADAVFRFLRFFNEREDSIEVLDVTTAADRLWRLKRMVSSIRLNAGMRWGGGTEPEKDDQFNYHESL